MRIKKIKLNDYKRFHKLTIDLGENPKRIVALVGPNGCGKSSIFDGMLFKENSRDYIGTYKRRDNNDYHSLNKQPNYSSDEVSIEFDQGSFDNVFNNKYNSKTHKTLFSFRGPFRYNSNVNVSELKSVPSITENNYGAGYTYDIDDKVTENYKRLNILYNQTMNDKDLRPSETKKLIIDELNNYIEMCLNIKICDLGDIQAGKGTLFFEKPDQKMPFEFNVLSSGEKEVVDILLDLYLRRYYYNDTIYLIDEPELHINTSIQRKLLVAINELIPENCQIWIATHSIGFLRALQTDFKNQTQIIEFDANNKWAEEEYILTELNPTRNDWLRLFSTALDDLAQLIAPDTIIYCEGKDEPSRTGEEQGLDALIYNKIFSQEFSNCLFVSSGGNTELDQRSSIAFRVLSKAFKDMQLLILKDRDFASGKMTTQEDRSLELAKDKNYRILKRFEIENYLYDKEILKRFSESKGYNFNETEYDSFVIDIVNQNLKDSTGKIKEICGENRSISKDNFKKELGVFITPDTNVYKELKEEIFTVNVTI